MSIQVRRASSRFVTAAPGRVTRHSFSFGEHYDPANLGFGLLVSHNDDTVQPGGGYADHPHRDQEIVTWVLAGALTHHDDAGRAGVTTPGTVQVMSAGSGVVHAETVAADAPVTRFVQTWLRPDEPGGAPAYSSVAVEPGEAWLPVVSGSRADAAARVRSSGATLWIASVGAGVELEVPAVARGHLFVATGSVGLDGLDQPGLDRPGLGEGDALRLTDAGVRLRAAAPSQLMLWTFGS